MIGLALLLAVSAAGCGASGRNATTTTKRRAAPFGLLKACLQQNGYTVTPESAAELATALRRFEFTAVWNLLKPSQVALALTFSRDTAGAEQAAVWTRVEDRKIGKGVVIAPVVRFGKIDVLWTAAPVIQDTKYVYGCIRRHG